MFFYILAVKFVAHVNKFIGAYFTIETEKEKYCLFYAKLVLSHSLNCTMPNYLSPTYQV